MNNNLENRLKKLSNSLLPKKETFIVFYFNSDERETYYLSKNEKLTPERYNEIKSQYKVKIYLPFKKEMFKTGSNQENI